MKILYAGNFGQSIATQLSASNGAQTMSLLNEKEEIAKFLSDATSVAVASWRSYPEVYDFIDQFCWDNKISWTLAELEGFHLNLGPLVVPTQSACFSCYAKRKACHHEAPDRKQAIEAAYDHQPDLGVSGFIQPLVSIACAHIEDDLRPNSTNGGMFKTVDVLTSSVLESEVIGIHECPRCRAKDAEYDPKNRYVEQLTTAAQGLMR